MERRVIFWSDISHYRLRAGKMKGLFEITKPTQGNDPALLPLYLDPNPMAPDE